MTMLHFITNTTHTIIVNYNYTVIIIITHKQLLFKILYNTVISELIIIIIQCLVCV